MVILLPPHFKPQSHLNLYDGMMNPQDHLDLFWALMLLSGALNLIMYQVLSINLKRVGLQWFTTLLAQLIISFKQLSDTFYTHFATSQVPKKTLATLVNFQQGK